MRFVVRYYTYLSAKITVDKVLFLATNYRSSAGDDSIGINGLVLRPKRTCSSERYSLCGKCESIVVWRADLFDKVTSSGIAFLYRFILMSQFLLRIYRNAMRESLCRAFAGIVARRPVGISFDWPNMACDQRCCLIVTNF